MRIGIDIENISRFKDLDFELNKGFYNKIFTENEIKYCLSKPNPSEHFAVRYCAKESFIKATDEKIGYKDVEIFIENNKPKIEVKGFNSTLSLTHDKDKAVAVVIVEKKELLRPNFNYIIKGRFFVLKPISINEINEEYVGWLNNPKINKYLEVRHKKQTIEDIYEYINGLRKSNGEIFGIFTKENKFVGTATLNPDFNNLFGTFGLMVGDLDAQRVGAGTEATILYLEFVFNRTKIRRIWGGAIDGNLKSISNLEKLGFKKEGTLRKQDILSDGEIKDVILYGILKEEWENKFIKNIKIEDGKKKQKKFVFVNIYSAETIARYLPSSYVLKSYLRKFFSEEDLDIEILNFSNHVEETKICETIIEKNPNYVGYSCYIWNIEKIIKIVEKIKERTKSITHIFGGPEISKKRILTMPKEIADYYVLGEGEKKLYELIYYLNEKSKENCLKFPMGIAYWENDELKYSDSAEAIKELDEIPSIYLNGIIEEEFYKGQQAFLETQRGCKLKCRYCVYHKNLPSISFYSLKRVFSELENLIINKKIKALRILDAIFPSDLERAKKIVRYLLELKRQNIKLPWIYWEFTPYHIDEEFIKLVGDLRYRNNICNSEEIKPLDMPQCYSGMLRDYTAINCIGIQSFCKEALMAVSRICIGPEKLEEFMNFAKKYNIALKIDLILGLPYETVDSYLAGLESFLPYFKCTDHILNIHRLQLLPGSELEELVEKYQIKYSKKAPHLVFSTNSMSESEINYLSKLTAILFRILNSPLRKHFFNAKEKAGESFINLIKEIYSRIKENDEFKDAKLIKQDSVDDIYWNDEIYKEIPSKWLIDLLENYRR